MKLLTISFLKIPVSRLFLGIIAIIFIVELCIMFMLPLIMPADASELTNNILNATILAISSSVVILPIIINFKKIACDRDLAIQIALDGYWNVTEDGSFVDVNPRYCEMIGYSRDQLLSMCIADIEAVESSANVKAHFELMIKQGQGRFSTRHRHANGETLDVELSVSFVPETGNFICFIRDITEQKQAELKLAKSETHLYSIINAEPECIKIVNTQGCLIDMNPAGLALIEAESFNQVAGLPVENLVAPEHREAFNNMHQQVIAGQSEILEFEIIGLKGGRNWMETHAVPMKGENDEILHLAITRNVTERKQSEQQLRIAATAFESQEGILITDASSTILRINQAFTKISGYEPEDLIGNNPRMLSSGLHNKEFYKAMWSSLNDTGIWKGEIWNRRKDGKVYPEFLKITAVKNSLGNITNYVATTTDISASKADQKRIETLAFYDQLTQIPNRTLLYDRLLQSLTNNTRNKEISALLFLDIDHFKSLNDTLGHDVGDLLLKVVADRLKICVRKRDTVARLGGDEFVILLERLGELNAEAANRTQQIAEKILTILNEPYILNSNEHHCTFSIGATLFDSHNSNADSILRQADIAMYRAKADGRNTLRFYNKKMQEELNLRVELEKDLRLAVQKNQFQLHYQVQVDDSNHAFGAEALIRWLSPDRGLVSPFHFIPLAEETGLIIKIGQWVLETACAQLKLWQRTPRTKDLVLSINVSPKQFYLTDFVKSVENAIAHYEIDPSRLKIELTESLLLSNINDTISKMTVLKSIGVNFSLDDFGTGYSSLQYLKRLPINQLKIDQSFVRDITVDSSDQAVVLAIIAMAHALNLSVIAEGIETEEQKEMLLNSGCKFYQGHLFGKPVPIEQFESSLKVKLI